MGMLCEISTLQPDGDVFRDALRGEIGPRSISLEKAWHGLHFLLTGSAVEGSWPLGFLLYDGEKMDADETTRRISPGAVRELSAALGEISDSQLWDRFDADKLAAEGVYPNIWDEPEQDLKQEYLTYFRQLKQFVEQA